MPASYPDLARSRYALLRSFRRDGSAVDTPIWFRLDGSALLFRTKIDPKTRRLAATPSVELRPCDYRGRTTGNPTGATGHAAILSGDDAGVANRALRKRYGWQWNLVPMIRVPGVVNVHRSSACCNVSTSVCSLASSVLAEVSATWCCCWIFSIWFKVPRSRAI